MTDREKAIVMAHTGVCMLAGEKLTIFYNYIEEIYGSPLQTLEIALNSEEIKEKSRSDFIKLCLESEVK